MKHRPFSLSFFISLKQQIEIIANTKLGAWSPNSSRNRPTVTELAWKNRCWQFAISPPSGLFILLPLQTAFRCRKQNHQRKVGGVDKPNSKHGGLLWQHLPALGNRTQLPLVVNPHTKTPSQQQLKNQKHHQRQLGALNQPNSEQSAHCDWHHLPVFCHAPSCFLATEITSSEISLWVVGYSGLRTW